jgi:hypothetical protein
MWPTSRLNGQPRTDSATSFTGRKWLVGGIQASLWAGTFHGLNSAWYAQYPRKPFHFFNDWSEWQQMDKLGHAWTTYQISRASASSWKWAGISEKKARLLGAASGMAFQSIIEILDGFTEKWGFSGHDMLANAAGASLFLFQSHKDASTAVTLKLSYLPVNYTPEWRSRASDLFGASSVGRILKDYNGQTYWISLNLKKTTKSEVFPDWLNLALGYGASTMLGGRSNSWQESSGQTVYAPLIRERKLLLSIDIDLTRIRTRKKWLKTTFSMLNCLKIPAPAIEYGTSGRWRLTPLHY